MYGAYHNGAEIHPDAITYMNSILECALKRLSQNSINTFLDTFTMRYWNSVTIRMTWNLGHQKSIVSHIHATPESRSLTTHQFVYTSEDGRLSCTGKTLAQAFRNMGYV